MNAHFLHIFANCALGDNLAGFTNAPGFSLVEELTAYAAANSGISPTKENQLKPGDVMNYAGSHVVIFHGWTDTGQVGGTVPVITREVLLGLLKRKF